MSRHDRLVGDIVHLSPTAAAVWRSCARRFRTRHLLHLPHPDPAADTVPRAEHGLRVHALLQWVHEHGDCHDARFVEETIALHVAGDAGAAVAALRRHADCCPRGAAVVGHELELARFRRRPPPMFMATGRIDVVWAHDGILDARDYKTGAGPPALRVADDVRARVQAWLLEPEAARRGLRLRLRYELLDTDGDDPEPWEPDGEELRAVEEELGEMAAAIRSGPYPGIADPATCGWCEWRTVCDEAVLTRVPPAGGPLPIVSRSPPPDPDRAPRPPPVSTPRRP